MDARLLSYFLAIVDHGGFGRAAEAVHVSQPSLSQAIKQLERDLGISLFHRVGRGVELSEPGRHLVDPARQVLRDLDMARSAVHSTRDLEQGQVDIAAMPSPGIEPLTTLTSRFNRHHPAMSISVSGAFTPEEVTESVRSGRAEIGLLGSAQTPQIPDLRCLHLGRQPLIMISPPGSEGPGTIRPQDWPGLNIVASPRGSLMRRLVDEAVNTDTGARVVAEVAHRTSLLPFVLAGLGHAVMPSSWKELATSSGCRVRRIEPAVYLNVSLLHRRQGLTPGAKAYLSLAEELAGEETAFHR